ncbi:aminoglycoside phosphotransferase family protein [Nonomuraea soli]|uniref:Aminoglycoside phosphotransferase (APT) family kinase protein n=1 Tax=Nonomuraea soli TaxID=1032476 RepID=A0A7W0CSE6_9ACTN|nr:aminoglycoside phosphotransferase family protein [Nonomuraea soli]MBA2896461.1 aminoglycoside phosphotransferase (APT) family kinase protein [Nonomuraea soli]
MYTPAAEVDVPVDLVDRLVRSQHPDLAGPLTLVANGWDNVIYRLGTDLAVRLPRREVAVTLIVNEQRWMPVLAGYVEVALPVPVRAGVPGEGYPWPWTIAPWFEGTTVTEVPPSERAPLAPQLAAFMNQLHRPAPADAPPNPVRGVALPKRDQALRQRLPHLERREELLALWETLVDLPPWQGPPVWLHGDPHPGNLLVSGSGHGAHDGERAPGGGGGGPRNGERGASGGGRGVELAAVLDFGDLTSGDPATDLAAGWLVFDEKAREVFRAHVDADEVTWQRARGWALAMGSGLATFSADNPAMAAIGDHVLEQVLLG